MIWFIVGACALVLFVVLALTLTILRFNQLSMARSLCDEAKRQLLVELRARHALVPAYIGTLQQITASDLSYIELALASAERAPFSQRGAAAENALTAAVNDAAQIPGTLSDKALAADSTLTMPTDSREELDTTVQLLHGQLNVLTDRILSGSRIYNTNVEHYHRQRERGLSRLFQRVFKAREPFTEAESPDHSTGADAPEQQDQRDQQDQQDQQDQTGVARP